MHGCPAAIATTSAFSELVKGRLLEEAELIDTREMVEALGGLPGEKVHCSCMVVDAFHSAMLDWLVADSDGLLKVEWKPLSSVPLGEPEGRGFFGASLHGSYNNHLYHFFFGYLF